MQAVQFARAQKMSISGMLKAALRAYLSNRPEVASQPEVDAGVNKLSDSLSSPVLVRPYRLSRSPQSRAAASVSGVAKTGGLLSDF
jgi:hypothetical protein